MTDKKKPSILGITPARGGSKQIPRKNILPIAGKPLIAWTIEHALAAKSLDRFVVSTEDAEIAEISRGLGADVLDRPAELARDETDTLSVLQHALREIPSDIIVVLQCTSPIRSAGLIDRSVDLILSGEVDCVGAVLPDKNYTFGQDMPRRQEITSRPLDIGNVYVYRSDLVLAGTPFGKRIGTIDVSREEAVEIDDDYDFWLAEKILLERPPK